jgi:tRNA(Met) C34 N-acetyltransferase TmcA
MAFDAADQVEPLDYNFDTIAQLYPGKYPILEGVKGTIPEPSDDAVQHLQHQLTAATKGLIPDDVDRDDRAALARAMRDLPEETFKLAEGKVTSALAELCAGSPTREQIEALPFRLRRKFLAWVQRELMDPESSTAATST